VNGQKGEVELERSTETAEWAEKVNRHQESGHDVFAYFSKYYSGYPPTDVEAMKGVLSTHPTTAGTRSS
jgi:uncharacterized protein YecE (DUF72 family)